MPQSAAPTEEVDMNFFFFHNSKERRAKTEEERSVEINFLELTAGLQVQVL